MLIMEEDYEFYNSDVGIVCFGRNIGGWSPGFVIFRHLVFDRLLGLDKIINTLRDALRLTPKMALFRLF